MNQSIASSSTSSPYGFPTTALYFHSLMSVKKCRAFHNDLCEFGRVSVFRFKNSPSTLTVRVVYVDIAASGRARATCKSQSAECQNCPKGTRFYFRFSFHVDEKALMSYTLANSIAYTKLNPKAIRSKAYCHASQS